LLKISILSLYTTYAKYHFTPLSSPLENVYFLYVVILNRKQSASDWGSSRTGFPLSREWQAEREWHTPCHPQPKAKRFGLGIQSLPSSRTWCGIQPCLDSRLRGNDKRNENDNRWIKNNNDRKFCASRVYITIV